MRKRFIWVVMILGFISCQKNEEGLLEKEEEKFSPEKAALSAKLKAWELLSVTDDTQVSLEEAKKQALTMAYQMQSREVVSGVSLFVRSTPINVEHVEELTNEKELQTLKDDSKKSDFYLIHFSNDKGYALVSADKRVPGVMAYNSSGDMDTDNNPGQAIMFSAIQNYVAVQKQLYEKKKDSLKQSALKKIKEHFEKQRLANPKFVASTNKSITKYEDDGICSLDNIHIVDDYYEDTPWVIVEQKEPLLKTIWGQQDAYNDLVFKRCPNDEAPVGCAATAVGQIMAYHKKPYVFKGRIMHWVDMTRTDYGFSSLYSPSVGSNPIAVRDIQHLLARLGDADLLNMHYTCSISTTNDLAVLKTFRTSMYNASNVEVLSVSKIRKDILANRPVYISGCDSSKKDNCHAWVLDGYMKKGRKTLRYMYIECPGFYGQKIDKVEGYITEDFVHCNFGWEGTFSGWYRIDVFDTNLHKTSSNIKMVEYDHNFLIITNIY